MSTRRIVRSIAVMATIAAFAVSALAMPAVAKGPKAGRGPGIEKVAKTANPKAAAAKTRAAERKAAAKARQAARFTATGTVVAVGTDTLTVLVQGGHTSLRGTEALITVPADARINRDDLPATFADLQVDDHVAVQGTRVEGALVAAKVNAESPEPVITDPVEDVTETVTEDPTEGTTEVITEEPTEEVVEPVIP